MFVHVDHFPLYRNGRHISEEERMRKAKQKVVDINKKPEPGIAVREGNVNLLLTFIRDDPSIVQKKRFPSGWTLLHRVMSLVLYRVSYQYSYLVLCIPNQPVLCTLLYCRHLNWDKQISVKCYYNMEHQYMNVRHGDGTLLYI